MPEIKNILYATDLSKNSAYAFQYATDMAEQNDAVIHIVHVLEQVSPSTRAMVDMYLSDEQKEKIAGRSDETTEMIINRLNVFCDRVKADDPSCVFRVASIDVEEGFPADEILKKADALDCDIVIMGTHGKGFISHAFLGSIAEKVLRRSTRPVMIIPLPKEEGEVTLQDI
jgi:nucleotide-binding universal stress UspA family protein